MFTKLTVPIGKAVRALMRLRGGGSALPGLIVERLDPDFVKRTLIDLPHGVVLVSGTNGKTTTTKMVVSLLESAGLKVFTNRTGSNFVRGVAAALVKDVDLTGHLDADVAVLELDEAHAVRFIEVIKPRTSLLLNVMRDQLDRFGEIDSTARLLTTVAQATSRNVILNREDPRIRDIAKQLSDSQNITYFGLSDIVRANFPNDDDIHSLRLVEQQNLPEASVLLMGYGDGEATLSINQQIYTTKLKIRGIYNVFNAAAAVATVRAVLGDDTSNADLINSLSNVTPAFGRGETLIIDHQPLELVLVKNPSGFRLSLQSFDPTNYATMIAINDNYADGRDMSWLWDVEFDSLTEEGVAMVTGVRAYDMALRLQYDEITVDKVDPDIDSALKQFVKSNRSKPKRIYCTYTAMLAIRKSLRRLTKVEIVS
ncbi:Mur ligase [Candidatus Saccharibacteria bacterium 32-49-12]|nr:MAG: Mur ligase [Candidatus Saccharibacteria bacterium 32-49-12]